MQKFLWLFVIIQSVLSEAPYPHHQQQQQQQQQPPRQYIPYPDQRPQLQCGLYGAPPCEYVPAPPGNTPNCAGPGKTYCEHVDHYPMQVIKSLIEKWGYDVQPHIVDETGDEFNDRKVTPHPTYGPPPAPTYGAPPAPTYGVPATPPVPAAYQPPPPLPDTSTQAPIFSSNLVAPANTYIPFNRVATNTANGYTGDEGYNYNPPRTAFPTAQKPQLPQSPQPEFFTPPTGPNPDQFNGLGPGPVVPKNVNNVPGNGFNGQQPVNVVFTEAFRTPPQNNFIPQRSANLQQQPGQILVPSQQQQPPFISSPNPTQLSPSQTTFTNPPPPQAPNQNGFQQNLNYFPTAYNQVQPDVRSPPPTTHYNPADWFRRYGRSLSQALDAPKSAKAVTQTEIIPQEVRSLNETLTRRIRRQPPLESLLLDESKLPENSGLRSKRQAFDQESLCQVRTQFIQPQAALNSKGNWMFVVNQVQTATQLVKTETCASNVCSGICQIPAGYSSRCEQKYVQKRLVALDGNGQRLYTDTFWFPSCCVCTISPQ
ncbi:Protein spaetzle 5 [Sergentomyia squamirostris]